MQNWQKNRNYKKFGNADGSFIYVITVDGQDVEVTEEVYKAYSQADRRERYCAERDVGRLLSIDRLEEDGVSLESLLDEQSESAEDSVIESMLIGQALNALSNLPAADQELIRAVVMNGVTEQDYADAIGVTQVAVHKRKKRILKNLFDFMVIKP